MDGRDFRSIGRYECYRRDLEINDPKTKLLDPQTFKGVQPLYTAAPVFVGCDGPVFQRSFLIEGENGCVRLDLPDEDADHGTSIGTHFRTDGSSWLDQIGGPEGFNEPIVQSAWETVRCFGDDLDQEAHFQEVRARALADDPGNRSKQEIQRYASRQFILDPVKRAKAKILGKDRFRSQRLSEAARPASKDNDHAVADPRTSLLFHDQAKIINIAELRLQRKITKAVQQVLIWKKARAERDALRQPEHDRIEAKLAKEYGLAVHDESDPNHEAFKKERRRRKADATSAASKTISAKLGINNLPAYPGNFVVMASTGLGKTHQGLQLIADHRDLRFDWMAPSHTLINQSRHALERLAPDRAIGTARGRSAEDPLKLCEDHPEARSKWDSSAMCPRHQIVNRMAKAGINANQTFCPTCPLKGTCGYRQQRRELAEVREQDGVIFAPSAYLQHSTFWTRGDIAGAMRKCW